MRTPKPWNHVFLNMAFDIAQRSKDPSTQAGAVLVDANNRIMGTGFNGPPAEINDELLPWYIRDLDKFNKYDCVIHAEENCILDALSKSNSEDIKGCVMYCTHMPCPGCVLRCIHAKLNCAIYHLAYDNNNEEKVRLILAKQKYYKNGPFRLERIWYYDSSPTTSE